MSALQPEKSLEPFDRDRTTLRLINRDVLRGTTSATLLEGFGRVLRGTAGGIGSAAAEAEDEYGKSFPLSELDIFFSHSWHAKWYLKYLTLLYHFNAIPAFCGASLVGLIVTTLRYRLWEMDLARYTSTEHTETLHFIGFPIFFCFGLGSLTLFTLLLSWHHLAHKLPRCFGGRTIFLDKVCIHQTDMLKKAQGIKSIGSILSNSKKLLVAWDTSYFARLWCVYELSAYKRAKPDAEITVIPITQGGVAAVLCGGEFFAELMLGIFGWCYDDLTIHEMHSFYILCLLPFMFLCTKMLQEYLNDIKDLEEQRSQFSVKKADCFCCANNHKHPDTGACLPCDRQVVYNSIIRWYGDNSEEGLDIFDNIVRTSFMEYIRNSSGAASHLPYTSVLLVGLLSGLSESDWNSTEPGLPLWRDAVRVLQWTFVIQPCWVGLLVIMVSRFHSSASRGILQTCLLCLVNCGLIRMLLLMSVWFNGDLVVHKVAWNLSLALAVWFMYFRRAPDLDTADFMAHTASPGLTNSTSVLNLFYKRNSASQARSCTTPAGQVEMSNFQDLREW